MLPFQTPGPRKLTVTEHNLLLGGSLILILGISVILVLMFESFGLLEFCREVCHVPESSTSRPS